MKGFVILASIILAGCQSVKGGDVVRHGSNCPPLTEEERLESEKNGQPIFTKDPLYPISAALKGIGGYVKLEFDISKEGNPINIRVIESYLGDTFVNTVEEAFPYWKFNPVVKDGEVIVSQCHSVHLDFVVPD